MKMLALFLPFLATAASAMPPSVPVAPIAVVAAGNGDAGKQLAAALRRLGTAGYVALTTPDVTILEVSKECALSGACITLPADAAPGQVIVTAADPGWHSADAQVRCRGADPSRASEARVYITDAATKAAGIAHPQLVKLSGCLIGAAGPR